MFKQALLFIVLALALLANASLPTNSSSPTSSEAPPPTSTDPNPTSSSAPAPAPEPEPAPKPIPVNVNGPVHFELHAAKGDAICAIGQFSGSIVFHGLEQPANLTLDIKTTLDTSSSTCDDKKIVLLFNVQDQGNTFSLTLNKEKDDYQLSEIASIYNYKNGTESKNAEVALKQVIFSVRNDNSYVCLAEEVFQLVSVKSTAVNATLTLKDFKIDAFRTSSSTDLRTASQCSLDNKPRDLVPLAVAIALVSLIVIVLISYLIGRKRSRRLTYESV